MTILTNISSPLYRHHWVIYCFGEIPSQRIWSHESQMSQLMVRWFFSFCIIINIVHSTFFIIEIFRVSSQHSKVLPLTNTQKDVSINQKKRIAAEEFKINKPTVATQSSKFERFRIFLEEYDKTYNGGTRTGHSIKDDFVVVRFVGWSFHMYFNKCFSSYYIVSTFTH